MNFRFAVLSDPHIALAHTISRSPYRFHQVELSIAALEYVLSHLEQLELDFVLIPGDLTQDGEKDNHLWLSQRLSLLKFPVYVIPGNHDVPSLSGDDGSIGFKDFPHYYEKLGYIDTNQLYYSCSLLPGVHLLGLNSNQFDEEGKQRGVLDAPQLEWLEKKLNEVKDEIVIVMIHHNIIEHLPGQSHHELGKRYMLENATVLKKILLKFGVKLVFTGHLHAQDVAYENGLWEITTGSLVSYPHPYRILELKTDQKGNQSLTFNSFKVNELAGWNNLSQLSRDWLGDRSFSFMNKMLKGEPFNLSEVEAAALAPKLRYFWADFAGGDALFDFKEFPPNIRKYFQAFGAIDQEGKPNLIDNNATINLF